MVGFGLYARFWMKEPLGWMGCVALIVAVLGVALLGGG
jgi:hypothetical protein